MRKEKLVTRRFEWAEVVILGFNPNTSEVEVRKFRIPNKMMENKKILEFVRKQITDDSFVPAKVNDIIVKSELRGMTESVFRENSHPIESRHNANEI